MKTSNPQADPAAAARSRRVEEASLNAWPALQQQFYNGWVLRFAKGFTKRANSIVPLYPSADQSSDSLQRRIRYCENLYAREGLQTIFRLTSISPYPTLDDLLAQRGYHKRDMTLVQTRDLGFNPANPGAYEQPNVQFSTEGLEAWLDAYSHLAQVTDTARRLHGAILGGIQALCGFGVLRNSAGQPIACGLAVAEGYYVGLFDIITESSVRGQGFGRLLVEALLSWSKQAGASQAYLQMLDSNAPAAALYQRLNFRPLYQYWYRMD